MKIKTNEGSTDHIIRAVAGVILLVLATLGFVGNGVWLWIAAILGAVLLVTSIVGFCPLYALLKIKTSKK